MTTMQYLTNRSQIMSYLFDGTAPPFNQKNMETFPNQCFYAAFRAPVVTSADNVQHDTLPPRPLTEQRNQQGSIKVARVVRREHHWHTGWQVLLSKNVNAV